MEKQNCKLPKVLVITVSSWNSKTGSNTWSTLVEQFGRENVANICIRDEYPDNSACARYFTISENRIIKSVFNRNIKTGREIERTVDLEQENQDLIVHNERYKNMRKKRRYSMLMAREVVWWLGKWRTLELDVFLDSFQPDVILHSMEGYIHLNRIIRYSIKRTGAVALGYIWDDNFTYKQSKNIGYKIYRFFQRRSLKKLARDTSAFFAISDMTKNEADSFFGIDCKILTKPLNSVPSVEYSEISKPIRMLYTGNLLIGRDRSLLKLVQTVKKYPESSFVIDVYTQTVLSEEQKKAFESGNVCRIHAPIPQKEVLEKQKEADVLIFLEDIDGPDARIARLSFSTKITDYLSSGKCIFAIGCQDTAPMQYFINNRAAVVATSESDIESGLGKLIDNPLVLKEYALNAANVGMEKHNREKVLVTFKSTIEETLKTRK